MIKLDDVRKIAEERAGRPGGASKGAGFESERQREKKALVKQLEAQNGQNVRMIAAAPEQGEDGRILRVAAYCRVSTDDIDQKISINLQIQQYMKKIKENPSWKYAGCYVDDGFSGTNTEHRQGFKKLMRDAMDGKIDMIITKAVSRFARNLTDCIGWVEALQNRDPPVRVYFEQENLDTMSQTSGIILFVLAMVAQEESHMKSEAVLLSLEWRFSRGRFLTPELFGYDRVEVADGFGGKKKVLSVNESEARVVRWMYATLLNGGSPADIAATLTEMEIPTGGRRRDGSFNTSWSPSGVVSLMRNEKYCGDVLARKTYTPNYKDHKSKRNNGRKNKYFQPDHHEAIVSRAEWNAAQRILNSRRYGHSGTYLPLRVITKGILTGYISVNRSWAGCDCEDCRRTSSIVMGLEDGDMTEDLEKEYLPEGGRRTAALIDDHGIARIARELTEAEREIKDELEGKTDGGEETPEKDASSKTFQVVNGGMFSRALEPAMSVYPGGIRFSSGCVSKLPGVTQVEILFNPVERMIAVRPCAEDHPNAVPWGKGRKGATFLAGLFYESAGWDREYFYRLPCRTLGDRYGNTVLLFDMDNYIGQSLRKKETVVPVREEPPEEEEAKSYYYPPDGEQPEEIREIEERFREAVEMNKRQFGTPFFRHEDTAPLRLDEDNPGLAEEAVPVDISHTFDRDEVDGLLLEIMEDPPKLPVEYTADPFSEEVRT